ncbi:hypothetical protein HYH02_000639 [Chlamydomonas schloesseri]|uniref:serine C-palmitoyltransferase n=1 Tax=Chlamydomonas schloesseri TaxID=2026947 RepID=A0A836BCT8_9CHLO|nr:hypothetical protein HYH02_000639 [Chlamydomonas schloesseri]|eukprot:KAG2454807.1 hypothetical protein HYH02_000639 [Chlamydomonas schloesseri]
MRRQAAQRLGVAAGLALLAAVIFAVLLVSAHAQASDGNEPIPTLLSFAGIARAFREFWAIVGPGGKLHPAYFLEHKGHLVIEAALIVVIVYLALQHSFKVHPRAEDPLTDKEIDQLCKEWTPEPLVPAVPEAEQFEPAVITGVDGPYVSVQGRKERVLQMAASNYLGMAADRGAKDASVAAVDKYGVGSCGPRGFYGTIDVHLELEEELARFYGTEAAILYSYDVATIASIIPAVTNRKDIIVCDEFCSYAVQAGYTVSRSRLRTFKHNDVADLERVIQQLEAEEKAKRRPLCRKLIIVEGIYANYGDLAPLDRIATIKEKYKYRLMVDESHAFGVLGATGRGACEHFGLKPEQVDIIAASMSHAMGSVGGFCVGDRTIVDHQRLSGSGYCFSASLPPYLAVAGINFLRHLRGGAAAAAAGAGASGGGSGQQQQQGSGSGGAGEVLPKLHTKIRAFRTDLMRGVPGLKLYGGGVLSPVLHLHVAKPTSEAADAAALRRVADLMLTSGCGGGVGGVLVGVSQYAAIEQRRPPPSLVMFVTLGLGDKELALAAASLRKAAKEVFKQ